MPSNAMSLSQLSALCQKLLADHGDLDCVFVSPEQNAIVALDGRNVNVAGQALGRTFAQPVVLFGSWRDQMGRITNQPGQAYLATDVPGDWRKDFENAPEDTDVIVWKRYQGQDIGKRVGDKWYVREGAAEWPARPIQIAMPLGILSWKLP